MVLVYDVTDEKTFQNIEVKEGHHEKMGVDERRQPAAGINPMKLFWYKLHQNVCNLR